MQRFTKAREYLAKERLPTEKSEAVVKMCCICLVILMTALCCLAVYGYRMLMGREIPFIIGLVTIAISTFAALVLISSQPENKSSVYFRVPLVPWLPALSLFLNIYLIILLDRASWIRFGIWLFIGESILSIINASINQSINQSINRSIDQSINQSITI